MDFGSAPDAFDEVNALPGGKEGTSGVSELAPAFSPLGPTGAPKRPRGRPRKKGRRPVVASGDLSDPEDILPKRKRGRPPGTGKRQRAAKAGATSGRGSPLDKKSGSFGSNYTGGSLSEAKSLESMTKRELQEALKFRNRRKRYIPRPAPPC